MLLGVWKVYLAQEEWGAHLLSAYPSQALLAPPESFDLILTTTVPISRWADAGPGVRSL